MATTDEDNRKGISISAVARTASCPLRFYIDRECGGERSESGRYTVCKQISYHLGDGTDGTAIWEECLAVNPGIDPRLRNYLEECLVICRAGGPWPESRETDVAVRSDALGIFGVVDKVCGGDPCFSIVRAAPAPATGIYPADRIRLFGYLTCLEEMTGDEIPTGAVEYIPSGLSRVCRPLPIDRRRFLNALRTARLIVSGKKPAKPACPPCGRCIHEDRCSPQSRRLSDLL